MRRLLSVSFRHGWSRSRIRFRRAACVAFLGAALVTSAGPLDGQGASLAVTPFVGLYVPTGRLGTWNLASIEGGSVTTVLEQRSSVALGARVTGRLTNRLALEGALAWTPSSVRSTTSGGLLFRDVPAVAAVAPGGASGTSGAAVWMGSAALLYDLLRTGSAASFYVKAGPALVSRTGSATWSGVSGRADLGGLAGIGARIRVGGVVAVRLDADDTISRARLTDEASGTRTVGRTQHDLLFTAALSIGIAGRR
ncbi:MAG: hypothetical protein Q8W51_03765 [Candidatus Palauibacterales bacterium]|nr:hypothetical protein [Candidatus Palauibacterales bacterium]MDP2528827.1 hypothetical protein [Candidatus Palauibacterales bacterium]